MRGTTVAGILFIVLGAVLLAYQGFTYTEKEEVFKAGPITATEEKERTVPISPVLGALSLAGGVVLLVMGSRRIG
jgi:hypothetical protein